MNVDNPFLSLSLCSSVCHQWFYIKTLLQFCPWNKWRGDLNHRCIIFIIYILSPFLSKLFSHHKLQWLLVRFLLLYFILYITTSISLITFLSFFFMSYFNSLHFIWIINFVWHLYYSFIYLCKEFSLNSSHLSNIFGYLNVNEFYFTFFCMLTHASWIKFF